MVAKEYPDPKKLGKVAQALGGMAADYIKEKLPAKPPTEHRPDSEHYGLHCMKMTNFTEAKEVHLRFRSAGHFIPNERYQGEEIMLAIWLAVCSTFEQVLEVYQAGGKYFPELSDLIICRLYDLA